MVPLLFLVPMIAVVFGVLTYLKKDPSPDTGASSPALIDSSAPAAPGTAAIGKISGGPALPVSPPPLPQVVQPVPDLPEGLEPVDPSTVAYEVLEKFLAAKTLQERLPHLETRTTEAELAKSCLAIPLPAASNIYQDYRETNPIEEVIDFYYNVDFDAGDNKLSPHTILVRKRGGTEPKIVADPFLDLYGGRLAAYAAAPSDKAGIFQAIVYAVASCNDTNIPNNENKLSLKLLPRDNADEIAIATFGRQSKIGMMLEEGTYDLRYGKAHACTVMLRWNTEDRPDIPYLEAIDIKTLDWNP